MREMRIGIGFDVHALQPGIPLFLGGVEIPHTHGLEGHSDADVLLHAISDAMLGATGERDIGYHFPDTDPTWAGISSQLILVKTAEIVAQRGFVVENIDSIIIAQRPKLAPYIMKMRAKIAYTLNLPVEQVSVKATTTEHLGFVGRGEGIAAQAVCLLRKSI
ncbi:MAG: 2-C-methyl-D-erythritol 2,4-cyclodiphosphate synthase [Firmicutes bacterium]|jgi:2-C-methyl-D-erythritol 2,4-cyclodiphosphate synthase|nr:2-C-methyl-D-erythritol 2,4-cyclodiphosphate synthase [Bacillota bacterium]